MSRQKDGKTKSIHTGLIRMNVYRKRNVCEKNFFCLISRMGSQQSSVLFGCKSAISMNTKAVWTKNIKSLHRNRNVKAFKDRKQLQTKTRISGTF